MSRSAARHDKVKKRRKLARQQRKQQRDFVRKDIQYDALKAILERAKTETLAQSEVEQLEAAVNTLAFLTAELEDQGTTLKKLRRLLFGSSSEKTRDVLPKAKKDGDAPEGETACPQEPQEPSEPPAEPSSEEQDKPRKKGHGRNGADAYTGAERVVVGHSELEHKGCCPHCDGKVYHQKESAQLVRITGLGPLVAQVYELERLRCNLCGEVFTADAPEGVGSEKYDASATAMIGQLKYNLGVPFTRIESLMKDQGIPMPSSTQYELVSAGAERLEPVWHEMVKHAAAGEVIHNDDTSARVLDLHAELKAQIEQGKSTRSGIFTSCVVSLDEEKHETVLFFTGDKHAGENLATVLAMRDAEADPPIQMSDALAHNQSGDFATIIANCNAHARRQFVDIAHTFPSECEHILSAFKHIYEVDARTHGMSQDERLSHHQEHSGPVMEALDLWLEEQFEQRRVEPNSALGKAMLYVQEHWEKLTLFLHVPGAPLDNNIVERALKRAIRHRKNSLFYKTKNGARTGDIWMSIAYTAERAGISVWRYLKALLEFHDHVRREPHLWLPWNFEDALRHARPHP